MKNLIILLLLSFSVNASAQFDVHSGTKLMEKIEIEGKTFDLHETSSGSKYIICNSPRTGNDYAVWVGEPTPDGMRISKKGTKFTLIISKNTKNPYCKYLKKSKE